MALYRWLFLLGARAQRHDLEELMLQCVQPLVHTNAAPQAKKAAIYIRIVGQRDQFEPQYRRQYQLCVASARELQLALSGLCFVDRGAQASRGALQRPGCLAAFASARDQHYNTLLVASLTILSGNVVTLAQSWDLLANAGVTLVAVKERINSSTPAGRDIRSQMQLATKVIAYE